MERVTFDGRPIAHVATEGGVSRQTLSKWVHRFLLAGEEGLEDMSSRPDRSPNRIPPEVEEAILGLRRDKKWGAQRIAAWLRDEMGDEYTVSHSTVHRVLAAHGISKVRETDRPTGESKRDPNRYEYERPGDMVHVDIKKVGVIPTGGGWRVHGRDTEAGRQSRQVAARGGKKRLGYAYLHNAVDDHSRLAYTEVHYDEKAQTCVEFWFRAVKFFQAHGVMHIERCLTDNGSPYRSRMWAAALATTNTRHKRTRPHTPRTNGKVERYNQIMMAEWLYVRPYDSEASRTEYLADFLNYYNYERKHSACGYKPPSSRVPLDTFRMQPQADWLEQVDVKDFELQPPLFEDGDDL